MMTRPDPRLAAAFDLKHLDAAFYAAGRLFGLSFSRRDDVPVYHPDVRVWANLGLHLAEKLRGAVALEEFRATHAAPERATEDQALPANEPERAREALARHLRGRPLPEDAKALRVDRRWSW